MFNENLLRASFSIPMRFPIEKWLEMTIAYFPHTVYLCTHKINNKK